MCTVHQERPYTCYHVKTGEVYNHTQHARSIVANKKVSGKILAKRINVQVEYIKHSKSRQLPEVGKGKRAEEESQRKRHLGSTETSVETQRTHFVRTNGKEPELLEASSYEFMA
ncbi:large ribosomal subunit protein eL21-like [Notamacropus eugenii]|uniref:large ribosomal subunit protein eL21-like n=1 Tax=Notamacropus eugenii TaxID=9315 RepID=UPI003B67AAA5